MRTSCVHNVYYTLVANCNQNAYMYEQPTKECGVRMLDRKDLNWCTAFFAVSQWFRYFLPQCVHKIILLAAHAYMHFDCN